MYGSTSPVLVALWDGIGPVSPELATWLAIPVARLWDLRWCVSSLARLEQARKRVATSTTARIASQPSIAKEEDASVREAHPSPSLDAKTPNQRMPLNAIPSRIPSAIAKPSADEVLDTSRYISQRNSFSFFHYHCNQFHLKVTNKMTLNIYVKFISFPICSGRLCLHNLYP